MADIETQAGDIPRTFVKLQPGEKVALCRCYGSKQFPLCDGTHRQHPGKAPVIVEAVAPEAPAAPETSR